MTQESRQTADVLVVGAGMAGLTAAAALQRAGCRVLVLDKGRGVGGRLASRRIGVAAFDHGAQFITARTSRFAALVSAEPAVTIHANHAFSLEHWERDRQESGRRLLAAANGWLGADVRTFQVHGWLYSKPLQVDEHRCAMVGQGPPLVLAGDAFAGPRVEGAALSGWTAAEALRAGAL